MGLFDVVMRATNEPTTAMRATQAGTAAAQVAHQSGHPLLAAAAGAAAAVVVAVDSALHTNAAPAGTYARFDTDKDNRR
jgi:hypothetical protein